MREDTCIFLSRLKNRLASQDANSKVGGSLFHRIGITIQKSVGAQLVARLPTKSLLGYSEDSLIVIMNLLCFRFTEIKPIK